jgi:hypothetical protein
MNDEMTTMDLLDETRMGVRLSGMSWRAVCLSCGETSPDYPKREDAKEREERHRKQDAFTPDVVLELKCKLPGRALGRFFGSDR